MARQRQKAGTKKRGTAPAAAQQAAEKEEARTELREKAALHARQRQESAARTRVLWVQAQLCALLLGALLLCRMLCPPVFAAARQYYFEWFEEADLSSQLVRFASALLDHIPVAAAQAAQAAPAGSSLETYLPAQALTFPLEEGSWRLSSGYGWRDHPITRELRFHQGDDLACAEGTPVRAALDGVVTAARRSTSYGNYLRVHHANGEETLYAHMQFLFVRAGEPVQAGQVLGTAGQTGEATGPHLHFELLQNGVRYDPAAALHLPEEPA